MKDFDKLISIFLIVVFAQFFMGIIFGILSGTAWNKYNMRGKEWCDRVHQKPQSYFGQVFLGVRYGQRVGCFLIEPRFNQETNFKQ